MTLRQYAEKQMQEEEKKYTVRELLNEKGRYEKEIADFKATIERLNAENRKLKDDSVDLEGENRHLAERVKLLEHKRDELIDELKRVGGDKERDIVVGQLMAYRQMFKMILDRGKE